jgi:hypothetical protein
MWPRYAPSAALPPHEWPVASDVHRPPELVEQWTTACEVRGKLPGIRFATQGLHARNNMIMRWGRDLCACVQPGQVQPLHALVVILLRTTPCINAGASCALGSAAVQ